MFMYQVLIRLMNKFPNLNTKWAKSSNKHLITLIFKDSIRYKLFTISRYICSENESKMNKFLLTECCWVDSIGTTAYTPAEVMMVFSIPSPRNIKLAISGVILTFSR
jgi:hypothetical protein